MLWVAQVAVEALPRMQVYNQNLTIRRLCIVIYSYNKSQQHALFLKSIVLLVKYTYNLSYRFYLCLNSFFQITLLIQNSEIRHWLNTNSCYVKRYGWLWPSTTVYIQIPVFWDVTLCHGASSCRQKYRSFATRVSQLKIWHFWVIGIERNVCRCTFNRYSAITQFAKLAAGEKLCRRCTQKIVALQNLQTFLVKNHKFWVVTLLSQTNGVTWMRVSEMPKRS